MKTTQFPIVVKDGSVRVKIYCLTIKGSRVYSVDYRFAGRRNRKAFADLEAAKTEAEATARKLATGEVEALKLTGIDRSLYVRAVQTLKPTGVSLDLAASQFAQAFAILKGDSLLDAASFYVKHHPKTLPKKSVEEVFNELVEAKTKAGRSAVYVTDLRYRCGAFARAFQCRIAAVTTPDVQRFLDSLNLSPRSHNNFIGAIYTLFEFAKAKRYLLPSHDVMRGIERQEETGEEIGIFSPEQITKLLGMVSADLLPVAAIGAFAGLRTAEIMRLNWDEIHLGERFIEIKKGKAKTRSRRLAPVTDNLAAWLAPYERLQGRVWPHSVPFCFEALKETAVEAGVDWRHNGLRHSFITYRLAEVKNENQVALEAGNSPSMIHQNYKGLVTERQAKAWFAIVPTRATNIIPMPAAATSTG